MNTRNLNLIAAATLIAGVAGRACAADQSDPWSLSILGGDSVAMTGSLRSPSITLIGNLGSIDAPLAGASGTLSLDKLRYEDMFRRRYDTGLELDYSFDPNMQAYGRFGYESLGGRTRRVGTLTSESLPTPDPLNARFSDADNMSFELGTRYYWQMPGNWRPFAGAALGATHLDGIRATFTSPGTDIDLKNAQFTRSSTVFSQSVETGIEYDPGTNFGLRLGAGADHVSSPRTVNDPALTALGVDDTGDAHGRWSFPVSIAANYRF
jgi:opacity protein-like surface antigen